MAGIRMVKGATVEVAKVQATIVQTLSTDVAWKAELEDGTPVVVKQSSMAEWKRYRFTKEIRFYRRCSKSPRLSTHVPKLFAYERRSSHAYQIMEYIPGPTFGKFYPKQVRDFAIVGLRVLDLVRTLAKERIIHHDLHSGNILIKDDAFPIVIDFEYAELTRSQKEAAHYNELASWVGRITDRLESRYAAQIPASFSDLGHDPLEVEQALKSLVM